MGNSFHLGCGVGAAIIDDWSCPPFFLFIMKQIEDTFTRDAFDKPGRGRPRKPNAKSPAQRMREYRQRKKNKAASISVTRYDNSKERTW